MKPGPSFVIVRVDPDFREHGGIEINRYYEETKIARARTGTIVEVCSKLNFDGDIVSKYLHARDFGVKDQQFVSKFIQTSVYYDVPIEVEPGDRVTFRHVAHDQEWLRLADDLLLIRYDNLVARGNYPLNGLLFLEMAAPAQDQVLLVPGNEFGVDMNLGRVVAEGCTIANYLLFPEYGSDFNTKLLGKNVLLSKKSSVRITHDDYTSGKPLYMTRRYNVNAYFD